LQNQNKKKKRYEYTANYNLTTIDNQRAKIRALLYTTASAYPPQYVTSKFGESTIQPIITSDWEANFTQVDYFVGNRINWNDPNQIGVQIVVYTHENSNLTFVIWRGTWSNPDDVLNGIWFQQFYKNSLRDRSINVWTNILGNSIDDLDTSQNLILRMIWDYGFPSYATNFTDTISTSKSALAVTTASLLTSQTYYAISKAMINDLLPSLEACNRSIVLSGHSLGGAICGLTSQYLVKKGKVYETILFSGYGSRCLAKDIAPSEVDYTSTFTNIKNYVDYYDIIHWVDITPGQKCRFQSSSTAKDCCKGVFGKGIENLAQPAFNLSCDQQICRDHTHNIYALITQMGSDANLNLDGSTSYGCVYDNYDADLCDYNYLPGGYVVFQIFIWIVVVLVVVGLILCCISICHYTYLKVTKKQKRLIPFCCCAKCEVNSGGVVDHEMYEIDK